MDNASLEVITNLVGSLGFPIFVAIYFMSTTNKALNKVSEAMSTLTMVIGELRNDIKRGD